MKWHYLIWGAILLAILFASPRSPVLGELETVFSKEIAFGKGELEDSRRVLAGRGYIWEGIWERWMNLSLRLKIIGSGKNIATHNEFLRILFSSGVLGLIINVTVLIIIGLALLTLIIVRRSSVDVVALMAFQMWLIDCIGLHPGLYPSYQWFVWGAIGLAIGGASPLFGHIQQVADAIREENPLHTDYDINSDFIDFAGINNRRIFD